MYYSLTDPLTHPPPHYFDTQPLHAYNSPIPLNQPPPHLETKPCILHPFSNSSPNSPNGKLEP